MSRNETRAVPWTAPVRFEDVPDSGRHIDLVADDATRAQLVSFAGLRALPRAEASFDIRKHGRDGLRVVGEVRAAVGQTCVVTLEPMESELVEPVDVLFRPVTEAPEEHAGDSVDAAQADPPEPLVDGVADLGALATEFLILGIDPYPRKPDAVFAAPDAGKPQDGPFAALAKLKSGGGADK